MKRYGKFTLFFLLLLFGTLVVSFPVEAGSSCHNINAKGVGQDLGNFMTQATIHGGGLLHGSTEAQFSPTGMNGDEITFTGPIVFTVNRATLSVTVNGTVNIMTGVFNASSTAMVGSGKLEGATGNLTFAGVENLSDGSFVETVTGSICVDLAP